MKDKKLWIGIALSSLLKSYRGQKPKVLKNRTSRVP
jgi:hypothetical protein